MQSWVIRSPVFSGNEPSFCWWSDSDNNFMSIIPF
jgi:hypothetical protein